MMSMKVQLAVTVALLALRALMTCALSIALDMHRIAQSCSQVSR
jgi:hypothetical protein